MFSAGNLREWRGRFFRPVGWPCRPRCTLAELYLQLQRGESVSLHFFRKAKPLPMDNLRKSGVEREPYRLFLPNAQKGLITCIYLTLQGLDLSFLEFSHDLVFAPPLLFCLFWPMPLSGSQDRAGQAG